jgi:hypothetical protein
VSNPLHSCTIAIYHSWVYLSQDGLRTSIMKRTRTRTIGSQSSHTTQPVQLEPSRRHHNTLHRHPQQSSPQENTFWATLSNHKTNKKMHFHLLNPSWPTHFCAKSTHNAHARRFGPSNSVFFTGVKVFCYTGKSSKGALAQAKTRHTLLPW